MIGTQNASKFFLALDFVCSLNYFLVIKSCYSCFLFDFFIDFNIGLLHAQQ